MKKYKSEIMEINILDLCVETLLHWRGAIIAGCIGAVIMGGLGCVKSVRAYNSAVSQIAKVQEDNPDITNREINQAYLESKLTPIQLENVRTVLAYEKTIEKRLNYINNSVYMNLDPSNLAYGDLQYVIRLDETGDMSDISIKEDKIKQAYVSMITSSKAYEMLSNEVGVGIDDLNDLISVSGAYNSSAYGSSVIDVSVLYLDEEGCRQIISGIEKFVDTIHSDVEAVTWPHDITMLSSDVVMRSSNTVAGNQRVYEGDVVAYRNSSVPIRKNFSPAELEYYKYMRNSDEDATDELIQIADIGTKGISVLLLIVGWIGFAILYFGIWVIMYIFDDRLRVCDDVESIFGMPFVGTLYNPDRFQCKILKSIDKLILSLRYKNRRVFEDSVGFELKASEVFASVRKLNKNKVYIVGCDIKDRPMKFAETLRLYLEESGIEALIENNLLYDHNLIGNVDDDGAVLVLETARNTQRSEVADEIALLDRLAIEPLGLVVVEK